MSSSTGWGQNELLFLQSKADAGKLIIVTGTVTGTGVVCSYTPASGQTFVLVKAAITGHTGGGNAQVTNVATVRNNTTVRDTLGNGEYSSTQLSGGWRVESIIKGDILVGDGAKTYDINCTGFNGGTLAGTIIGYLE